MTHAALDKTLDELRAFVEQEIARLRQPDNADKPEWRMRLLKQCTGTLKEIARLTGEGLVLTDRKFQRLPQFRRVWEVMATALEPWPEAMRAVADALQKHAAGDVPQEG